MTVHRKTDPPTFITAPASCWSVVADSPHTRTGCSPYGLYTTPSANVSHPAGTVGTTDIRNR